MVIPTKENPGAESHGDRDADDGHADGGRRKRCNKCGRTRDIGEFHADKEKPDGHHTNCRECRAAYQRTIAPHYRTKAKRWKEQNPYKVESQRVMAEAIEDGVLKRVPCTWEYEGGTPCGEIKVQGHHPFHGKPLEVLWRCRRHHSRQHVIEGKQSGESVVEEWELRNLIANRQP